MARQPISNGVDASNCTSATTQEDNHYSDEQKNQVGTDNIQVADNAQHQVEELQALQDPSDKKGPGILLRTMRPGDVTQFPQFGDTVKVHYEVYLTNPDMSPKSKPIDSSRERQQPFCFVLGKREVIEGLDVALERMSLGQVAEIIVPYLYAYGEAGYPPGVPPRSTLLFRLELLDYIVVGR